MNVEEMTSLTRIMEDLWVEVGAILQPVPGMKYVKVFDDAHKPRKDCYFVLELTGERLPTPLPFPDDSNLASVFTSPLVLRDAAGNFLAKVTGDNPIELTPQEFPSFLKIDDVGHLSQTPSRSAICINVCPSSSRTSRNILKNIPSPSRRSLPPQLKANGTFRGSNSCRTGKR
jgi:hypothetical protein